MGRLRSGRGRRPSRRKRRLPGSSAASSPPVLRLGRSGQAPWYSRSWADGAAVTRGSADTPRAGKFVARWRGRPPWRSCETVAAVHHGWWSPWFDWRVAAASLRERGLATAESNRNGGQPAGARSSAAAVPVRYASAPWCSGRSLSVRCRRAQCSTGIPPARRAALRPRVLPLEALSSPADAAGGDTVSGARNGGGLVELQACATDVSPSSRAEHRLVPGQQSRSPTVSRETTIGRTGNRREPSSANVHSLHPTPALVYGATVMRPQCRSVPSRPSALLRSGASDPRSRALRDPERSDVVQVEPDS